MEDLVPAFGNEHTLNIRLRFAFATVTKVIGYG